MDVFCFLSNALVAVVIVGLLESNGLPVNIFGMRHSPKSSDLAITSKDTHPTSNVYPISTKSSVKKHERIWDLLQYEVEDVEMNFIRTYQEPVDSAVSDAIGGVSHGVDPIGSNSGQCCNAPGEAGAGVTPPNVIVDHGATNPNEPISGEEIEGPTPPGGIVDSGEPDSTSVELPQSTQAPASAGPPTQIPNNPIAGAVDAAGTGAAGAAVGTGQAAVGAVSGGATAVGGAGSAAAGAAGGASDAGTIAAGGVPSPNPTAQP